MLLVKDMLGHKLDNADKQRITEAKLREAIDKTGASQ